MIPLTFLIGILTGILLWRIDYYFRKKKNTDFQDKAIWSIKKDGEFYSVKKNVDSRYRFLGKVNDKYDLVSFSNRELFDTNDEAVKALIEYEELF